MVMSDSELWNWDNDKSDSQPIQSEHAVDISFKLTCRCLHVDHTIGLHKAVADALPWFKDEPLAGLHLIYVAGSQNGWMRPEEPDELLYLAKRTRLTLRIPTHRIDDAQKLIGQTLNVSDHDMTIGESLEKPVVANDILLSRHVIADDYNDENIFLKMVAKELDQLGVKFRKLLPGKQLNLRSPNGIIRSRSLMVADIEAEDSLTLQEQGLGHGRQFGCGIFIHHKGIKAVNLND